MNPTPTPPPAGKPQANASSATPKPEAKATPTPPPNPPKTEDKAGVSFWEKMGQKQSSPNDKPGGGVKKSLVNAIVSQAEKAVNQKPASAAKAANPSPTPNNAGINPKASASPKPSATPELSESHKEAHSLYSLAKDLLTLVVILSLGAWLYFHASLDEGNYFHSKFGKQNITTQLTYKEELLQQLKRDIVDVKEFSELLQVENLANEVVELDLDNHILNWEKPEGEKVRARGSSDTTTAGMLYKSVEADGSIVYYSEKQILELEDKKVRNLEIAKKKIEKIISESENLKKNKVANPKISENLTQLSKVVEKINVDEKNFPSAITKQRFAAAKAVSHNILLNVKNLNLENLVKDIKKQAQAIDISEVNQETREVIEELKNITNRVSANQPSSFEKAIRSASMLDFAKINDNEIYKKVALITNGAGNEEEEGDLKDAFIIAKNLGTVNIINSLRANRKKWSTIIERVEKVARLGADAEKDIAGEVIKDARKDIDSNGNILMFNSYSAQSGGKKGDSIVVSGEAYGVNNYKNKNFTLVADLVDSLEGSKYFQDVEGYAYTKSEDGETGIYKTPLNFNLTLQDPTQQHPYDVAGLSFDEEEVETNGEEEIDLSFLDELDFLGEEEKKPAASENPEEEKAEGSEEEISSFDPFAEIRIILNPIQ